MRNFYAIILIFFSACHVFGQTAYQNDTASVVLTESKYGNQYKFINPLLDCYDLKPTSIPKIKRIGHLVDSVITHYKKEKEIEEISFYVRDMENGPWYGVNEDKKYIPASLLKVPTMIALLLEAQEDPDLLSLQVYYEQPSENMLVLTSDSNHIIPGHIYTIETLMRYMISNSDNEARLLLLNYISDSVLMYVYQELGLQIEGHTDFEEFISAKDYASFLRVLYNATLLNKNMSQKALYYLSESSFHDGLEAGIPKGVVIAHKFGERGFPNSNVKYLHDCGIVYKAENPYLICVMTKGVSMAKQQEIIATISKIVYDNI